MQGSHVLWRGSDCGKYTARECCGSSKEKKYGTMLMIGNHLRCKIKQPKYAAQTCHMRITLLRISVFDENEHCLMVALAQICFRQRL
jgi:hypothetical protein